MPTEFIVTYADNNLYALWRHDGEGAYRLVLSGLFPSAWLELRDGGTLNIPAQAPYKPSEV